MDRLEHALRKVDMAQWEHTRFTKNMQLGSSLTMKATPSEFTYLINLLTSKMAKLGMHSDEIIRVVNHFRIPCNHRTGLRKLISLDYLSDEEQNLLNVDCHNGESTNLLFIIHLLNGSAELLKYWMGMSKVDSGCSG